MNSIAKGFLLSRSALAPHLPDRWRHVQGVATLAQELGAKLRDIDSNILVQAAWLHDIGYSPLAVQCGFHPLDGARYLAGQQVSRRVVALVAHHSAASIEAQIRGIDGLAAYEDEMTPTRDALWYCDARIGPLGQLLIPQDRWLEIRQRYGPDHLVAEFLDAALPTLRAAVDRTETRLQFT